MFENKVDFWLSGFDTTKITISAGAKKFILQLSYSYSDELLNKKLRIATLVHQIGSELLKIRL